MIKLCQIISKDDHGLTYWETADEVVMNGNIVEYPITLNVEVIDWVSEEEFHKRGKINSFTEESIVLPWPVPSVRDFCISALQIKYPSIVRL